MWWVIVDSRVTRRLVIGWGGLCLLFSERVHAFLDYRYENNIALVQHHFAVTSLVMRCHTPNIVKWDVRIRLLRTTKQSYDFDKNLKNIFEDGGICPWVMQIWQWHISYLRPQCRVSYVSNYLVCKPVGIHRQLSAQGLSKDISKVFYDNAYLLASARMQG